MNVLILAYEVNAANLVVVLLSHNDEKGRLIPIFSENLENALKPNNSRSIINRTKKILSLSFIFGRKRFDITKYVKDWKL